MTDFETHPIGTADKLKRDEIRFTANDCFYIKGKGFAFSGSNPEETTREGLRNRYVGKRVIIYGRGCGGRFLVVGVESHAIEHQRQGAPIALLVETE